MEKKEDLILKIRATIKEKFSASEDELDNMLDPSVSIRDKSLYKRYHTLQMSNGCTHKQAVMCTDDFFKVCNKLG